MNKLNTTSVSLAVTPIVVSTLFSHFLNRKPLKQRPTAHLSYDQGLNVIRAFLEFAAQHTVEELQAFTSQWVPNPQWIRVETATVSSEYLSHSAELIHAQLGSEGLAQVGGRQWWQWRKPQTCLEAEWIEMKAHYNARKASNDPGRRIMLYVHGGAYFFGSVDEHRYQMQRHARKLKARVFAPRYRLAPQFPFPCGLQDCLAAYLYLLSFQDPNTILLAGDSAGGGMVMSMLCIIRDQGIPLPAGGILLSPWVDLTHSFPSLCSDAPLDYIPHSGFHHKPSRAWPPLNDDDMATLQEKAAEQKKSKLAAGQQLGEGGGDESAPGNGRAINADKLADLVGDKSGNAKHLTVAIDGAPVVIKDQIQLYTTNALVNHPLVSPVLQSTLGGLPPLLILVGGGEILRDEQIFLAHKCANPSKYAPPRESLSEKEIEKLQKYKPTDVQLQVWDDLCHVAPTLSFTRPAKLMFRSVAQFGAWALARAQKRGIDILDDDEISVVSGSDAGSDSSADNQREQAKCATDRAGSGQVGRAGDPLPHFRNHMIRQRVTRHGVTLPLAPESDLTGCCVATSEIGVVKEHTVKKWLETRKKYDQRYASAKAKVHQKIIKDMIIGFQDLGPDEHPPPTALAGRRLAVTDWAEKKKSKSFGLALWSLWGSKHDELTAERESEADRVLDIKDVTGDESRGARAFEDIQSQQPMPRSQFGSRSRSRRRTVIDEHQTDGEPAEKDTHVAELMERRKQQEAATASLLSPDFVAQTGVAGKRPFIQGTALPFSLKKDADTASMVTLNSSVTPIPDSSSRKFFGHEGDSIGHPTTADVAKAEELLAAGTARPAIEKFLSADAKVPRIQEPVEQKESDQSEARTEQMHA